MKFYSYDYVLSQISQQNWVSIGISGLLILLTGFFAVKAYRDKHDSKFRELSIISILTLVAVVLIGISNFQNSQATLELPAPIKTVVLNNTSGLFQEGDQVLELVPYQTVVLELVE